MIKEQRITYETSKLALEYGFNEGYNGEYGTYNYIDTGAYTETLYGHGKYHDDITGYEDRPEKFGILTCFIILHSHVVKKYPAPLKSTLQTWFRNEHQINISVYPDYCIYDFSKIEYAVKIYGGLSEPVLREFETFEDALEAGLFSAFSYIK